MEVFCKDGSTKWTETSYTVIGDDHGKFNGVMGISRDITERRRAEKALKESEQRYRSLFHYNPAMTYAIDRNGYFTSINAAARRISGYSEEEALKMHFSQLIPPEYMETVNQHYEGSLRGEPQSYEAAFITKDGRRIEVQVTGIPIVIDGNAIGVYGITEDITGRKKAAEDLRAALEKASSTLEGTIEAIAMMSELRDPYTAGHQRMVSQLAVAIAEQLGLEQDRVQDLAVAGLLHDVGKVYVPSEILSKPGKLTSLELGLAKAHAEASYNIVRSIKFSGPIAQIVWQHHERIDGSGYPRGLVGDQIMLEARILAVSDVVEAMVSHRPYRPALGLDKALEEITGNRAVLYDEQAVDACLVLFNEKGFKFRD
jgi:PAS domain S-box-containing protein/putative nucleotidyltransferase with HDIG domain